MSLAEFETQLLALPEADRIHLVDVLWESLVSGDVKERTQKWAREAEGRLSAVQSGQLPLVESEQVFQEQHALTAEDTANSIGGCSTFVQPLQCLLTIQLNSSRNSQGIVST